jgi:hypothetical protein
MSSDYDLLMIELVRRLGAKLDALAGQVRDLQHRMTRVELQLAASAAAEAVHHAVTAVRLDRLEARLDRIEHRPNAPDRSDPA